MVGGFSLDLHRIHTGRRESWRHCGFLGYGKGNLYAGALVAGADLDLTGVVNNRPPCDWQSQADSASLRSTEGREELLLDLARYAVAVVQDAEEDP